MNSKVLAKMSAGAALVANGQSLRLAAELLGFSPRYFENLAHDFPEAWAQQLDVARRQSRKASAGRTSTRSSERSRSWLPAARSPRPPGHLRSSRGGCTS